MLLRPTRQNGRMPGLQGLPVDEPAGKRWELALSLLETGEPLGRQLF